MTSLPGLDAAFRGAVIALLLVLPATALFWRLTAPLAAASRAQRSGVVGAASYGLTCLAGVAIGALLGGEHHLEDAVLGAVLAGIPAQLLTCAVLLVLPRSRRA